MMVLYLEGDRCSPKYVVAALEGAAIQWRAPQRPPPEYAEYDAVILSDYPASTLGPRAAQAIAAAVHEGLGLLMVGGWSSFGRGGYARSPLAEVLPVEVEDGDDRHASPSGCYPWKLEEHPILGGLDWSRPPVLCGYNRLVPKPAAEVVLEAREAALTPEGPHVARRGAPLLVLGGHGQGRVVAFAGDLAPHWSGGLTDWGESTVAGPEGEEVGSAYVALLAQMIRWAARPRPRVGQARVERL